MESLRPAFSHSLDVAGLLADEGARLGLPSFLLAGRPAKGASHKVGILDDWDPWADDAPIETEPSELARLLQAAIPQCEIILRNAYRSHTAIWRSGGERVTHESTWFSSASLAQVAERTLQAFERLSLAVKIGHKPNFKLAANQSSGSASGRAAYLPDLRYVVGLVARLGQAGRLLVQASQRLVALAADRLNSHAARPIPAESRR